jgi:predicted O-methyltransferase YrrM
MERYICDSALPPDPVLDGALARAEQGGLPPIAVAPNHGKLLHLLALMQPASTILELGTLGGYSTIWLARALPPDGRLITVERDREHAALAAQSIAAAGLDRLVELRVADALDELDALSAQGAGPFDLVFIDADKERIPQYFERSLALSRPGSLIVVDNVVRGATVLDPASADPAVHGVRRFYEQLRGAEGHTLSATVIQTVGSKGYDGFALVLVGEPSAAA